MPVPMPVTILELEALEDIRSAYYAMNRTDTLCAEWTLGPSPAWSAMGLIAEAGRTALRQLNLPVSLWDEMINNGENFSYNLQLWANR